MRTRPLAAAALAALCACVTLPDSDAVLQPCRDAVSLENRAQGGSIEVVAHSRCHVPVLMELSLAEIRNLEPSQPLPARFALAAGASRPLLTLERVDSRQDANYRASLAVIFGTGPSAPDPEARYAFPFGGAEPRRLVQGVDGAFTHKGDSRFAFDFEMPRGTPVLAARDGIVLLVVDGFPDGGEDEKFRYRSNGVHVLHGDGTIASYGHFDRGVPVREGQHVRAGDLLGASGNSGQSKGPHLHFQVSAQRFGQDAQTVPIVFVGGIVPAVGSSYGPYPGDDAEAAR